MTDSRPIGVFDSGVGGLTVLRELRRQMPSERLLYIADLAHFPYGPRPQAEVRDLALRVVDDLTRMDTKLVVIACNTATAAALDVARERFDVPIVGVIAPGAQAAALATHAGRVAVLSTEGTLRSQAYVHAIKEANPGVAVLGIAAPDLVDIVEEGAADTDRAETALNPVLSDIIEWGADTLVLGCTHYPLLRAALRRSIGRRRLAVIDSAETTAARVRRILAVNRLEARSGRRGALELLVTGSPDRFNETARRLFGEALGSPRVLTRDPPVLRAVAGR